MQELTDFQADAGPPLSFGHPLQPEGISVVRELHSLSNPVGSDTFPSLEKVNPSTSVVSSTLFPKQQQTMLKGSSMSDSTPSVDAIGIHPVNNDPICILTDIEEFEVLSLMTRFQPELQLFV
jgi:hypothetical protein